MKNHIINQKIQSNSSRFILVIMLISFFAFVGSIFAGSICVPDTTDKINNEIELEINGLLVDETQSKTAKEFYDLFYTKWEAPLIDLQYSIFFSEKPMPRFGTLITITINEQVVFSKFVQPRYEKIEEMSEEALQLALSYLDNYKQIQSELMFDEMQGSGIY